MVDVGQPVVAMTQLVKIGPFHLGDGPKGGLASLRFRMGDIYASVTKMMTSGEISGQADDVPERPLEKHVHYPNAIQRYPSRTFLKLLYVSQDDALSSGRKLKGPDFTLLPAAYLKKVGRLDESRSSQDYFEQHGSEQF